MFSQLFSILLPILLLVLGYVAGKMAEARHYRSLERREKACYKVPVVTSRTMDEGRPIQEARMALGSVVVSVDHYKRFLAGFRMIFGGEMHSYSSLIDRGRREALLRMRESFREADLFLNCRLETASISKGQGKATGTVEVVAYATGIKFQA